VTGRGVEKERQGGREGRVVVERRNGGFTLLEVLVGLAVGGVVLLAGFAALAAVHDRTSHALAGTQPTLEASVTRALLTEWLAGAQRVSNQAGVAFTGEHGRDLGTDSDELTFPTRTQTPLGTGITAIRLRVETDASAPLRGLLAELSFRPEDEPYVIHLAPGVTSLRIRYRPDTDGVVEWTDSWVDRLEPPRAVELTFHSAHPEDLPPLLRLPLRVALPVIH
jgi:prepilin-type N-terminal cleavage/methylation domain-containing protein